MSSAGRSINEAVTGENSLALPHKVQHNLHTTPAILLLGMYPRRTENCIQTNVYRWTFMVTLFTAAEGGYNPTDKWITKMWLYLYKGLLFSHKKE